MQVEKRYGDFHGAYAGPVLLVRCAQDAKRELYRRLSYIPSFGYMRGAILIAGDAAEEAEARKLEMIDDEMTLSSTDNGAIFIVLRRATELGMIAGRGVPGAIPSTRQMQA